MSEQEINRIIAENIVRYMEMRGLSQADIATYMGVSQASVSNWCKGIKMPRMDKIDRLCELFGCSRSDLLDEAMEETDLQTILEHAYNDNPDKRILFSMIDNATAEEAKTAIRVLSALWDKKDD